MTDFWSSAHARLHHEESRVIQQTLKFLRDGSLRSPETRLKERRTRSAIMARAGNVLILVAVVLGGMGPGVRGQRAGRAGGDPAVRPAYIEANNGADPTAILDMVSRSRKCHAEMGHQRGWDSIRAELDKSPDAGTHTVSLGIDGHHSLGPRLRPGRRSMSVDLAAGDNQAQLRGAMTLVLEKSSGNGRSLHEHDSLHFRWATSGRRQD